MELYTDAVKKAQAKGEQITRVLYGIFSLSFRGAIHIHRAPFIFSRLAVRPYVLGYTHAAVPLLHNN